MEYSSSRTSNTRRVFDMSNSNTDLYLVEGEDPHNKESTQSQWEMWWKQKEENEGALKDYINKGDFEKCK